MKCFHHDDIDGRSAGALIAIHEDNFDQENFFEVNYVQKLPIDRIKPDEKVYFVDYSFSKNTVGVLREILSITNNVVWIDHHKSSVEMLKDNPDLKSIDGIVKEGISGAALTYMYLYSEQYSNIPLYLKYVSDFDCWHLKLPNIMEFKYGVECYDYKALSDFWIRLMENDTGTENKFLQEIIGNGTVVRRHSENEFRRLIEENSYERDVEGYKALILNSDGFSQVFGDKINDYDVCILWSYIDGRYVYSIYSTKVDVSKIAEKYSGGGHFGAAGFSSTELLFK